FGSSKDDSRVPSILQQSPYMHQQQPAWMDILGVGMNRKLFSVSERDNLKAICRAYTRLVASDLAEAPLPLFR
ncbi:hypothetical protein, partial [Salmonella enterica]|uniref:hypothetical protein n=1 Tax=Salmonella enterica TaxID=28901 RepID=UPI0020C58242